FVDAVLAKSGERVQPGQPLLRLRNPELELDFRHTQARRNELQARLLKATADEIASLKPLRSQVQAIEERLKKLEADRAALVVQARHAGIWVAPNIDDLVGRWIARGNPLGLLVDPASFEFQATVMQVDVDALFARKMPGAEIRLY